MCEEVEDIVKSYFTERNLAWQGCYNVRDLGGLLTLDGTETRWKSVIRADNLNQLTDSGRQALLHYGVRTIIDLRSPQEVAEDPPVRFKEGEPAPANLNLPIEKYYPHVSDLIMRAKSRAEVYCIILDHYPDLIVDVLRAIAAAPGGIVIHCHSGTDRTGMISALLLRLACVSKDLIVADYAESQVRRRSLYESIAKDVGDEDEADFWRRPTATPEMMIEMLSHLDFKYGGVEGYLIASGLPTGELSRLKDRMRSSYHGKDGKTDEERTKKPDQGAPGRDERPDRGSDLPPGGGPD